MRILEVVRQMINGERPPMPLASLMGYRVTAIEPGHARVEFEADGRHANPMGTVHGGAICAIADTAMGLAYGAALDDGELFATIELKINFLRPVSQATLAADAVVVQKGRRIGMTECSVTDHEGRLIAKATSTCMTQRGNSAAG